MFLLRAKFWMLGGLAILTISAGMFGGVAMYHKRAQDPNRTPHDQQQNENTSETVGYFASFVSAFALIAFFI